MAKYVIELDEKAKEAIKDFLSLRYLGNFPYLQTALRDMQSLSHLDLFTREEILDLQEEMIKLAEDQLVYESSIAKVDSNKNLARVNSFTATSAFYNGSDDDDEKTVPNGTLAGLRGSLPYSHGSPGSPFSGHKGAGINKDAWLPWDDTKGSSTEHNKQINQDFCYHEWKQYTGLNETFRYCTKCDKKKT